MYYQIKKSIVLVNILSLATWTLKCTQTNEIRTKCLLWFICLKLTHLVWFYTKVLTYLTEWASRKLILHFSYFVCSIQTDINRGHIKFYYSMIVLLVPSLEGIELQIRYLNPWKKIRQINWWKKKIRQFNLLKMPDSKEGSSSNSSPKQVRKVGLCVDHVVWICQMLKLASSLEMFISVWVRIIGFPNGPSFR